LADCVASPPEKAAKGSFKNGCNFLVPQGQNGRPFAGLIHANGKIQITSICSLTAVDPCIRQVVDLLKDAHSRSRAPVIIDYDAVTPLVLMQVSPSGSFAQLSKSHDASPHLTFSKKGFF
jgi:hypothetical protein